jgi:hypothetical protein
MVICPKVMLTFAERCYSHAYIDFDLKPFETGLSEQDLYANPAGASAITRADTANEAVVPADARTADGTDAVDGADATDSTDVGKSTVLRTDADTGVVTVAPTSTDAGASAGAGALAVARAEQAEGASPRPLRRASDMDVDADLNGDASKNTATSTDAVLNEGKSCLACSFALH